MVVKLTPGYKLRCVYSLANFLRMLTEALEKWHAEISLSLGRDADICFLNRITVLYSAGATRMFAVIRIMTLSDNSWYCYLQLNLISFTHY